MHESTAQYSTGTQSGHAGAAVSLKPGKNCSLLSPTPIFPANVNLGMWRSLACRDCHWPSPKGETLQVQWVSGRAVLQVRRSRFCIKIQAGCR